MSILPRTEAESQEAIEVRDNRNKGWFWADNELIDEFGAELGPYGLATYIALCKHASEKKDGTKQTCYPSYATLARETGMSRRQTMRAIRKLEALGLISIEPRTTAAGDPTSNLFKLLAKSNWGGGDSQSPGVVTGSHQGSDSQSPGVVTHSHPNNNHPDKIQENRESLNNNNGAGNVLPSADAAAGVLSLSQFLTDNGIRGKKLKDILKLNPPVEHARSWLEYARSNQDVKKPEGFMIAMLLDEVPPPQRHNGRWYTDDELRENFVPPGVNAWEWKQQRAMTPEEWEATLSDHVPDGMLVTRANGKKYRQIGSHRLPEGVFYDQFNQRTVRKDENTGEWVNCSSNGYYVAKPFDEAESERIKAEVGAAFDGIKARRNSLTPEQEKLCREIDAKHGRNVPGWASEDWQTETPDFIRE